jgi:hypothetical protein
MTDTMARVRQLVWVRGNLGMCRHVVRFDTRYEENMIRRGVAETLGRINPWPGRNIIRTPSGRRVARGAISASLLVQGHKLWPHLNVIDELDDDVVIGAFFLRHWYIRLDPKRNRLIVNPRDLVLRA